MPDGSVDLLSYQYRGIGPIRAYSDYRARKGRRSHTLKVVPRPSLIRTNCMRQWSNWSRWTTPISSIRRCRTGMRATKTAWVASTILLPSVAWPRGVNSRISWTQVETGSAITWKYPSCVLQGENSVGEFYSVAVTNNYQQADTGTKMIHIGKNTRSTIVSKGISAGHSNNSYRGLVRIAPTATGARNYSQCDSMLIGDSCGANTFPYIQVRNHSAKVEHEASTSKIGEDQLFYFAQRGIGNEEAVSMIINGFCKDVFQQLPMEFAVEATKLLGFKLEGSVG